MKQIRDRTSHTLSNQHPVRTTKTKAMSERTLTVYRMLNLNLCLKNLLTGIPIFPYDFAKS